MSNLPDRIAGIVTGRSRTVVLLLLVVSMALGAGATQVQQSSSLDQFQSDTPEGDALQYAEANFTTGAENVTAVQVIIRGDNVLSRPALLAQLHFEQAVLENESVGDTLVQRQPIAGIANIIATTAIRSEQAAALQERAAALQADFRRVNRTADGLVRALNETRRLQLTYDRLNRSYAAGEINQSVYQRRATAIEANLSQIRSAATASITALPALNQTHAREFAGLLRRARTLQAELDALNASYRRGEINASEYQQRAAAIQESFQVVYRSVQSVLTPAYRTLRDRSQALTADRRALQNATRSGTFPPLSEQIAQLESMNASALDRTIRRVLSAGGGSGTAFAFMPTSYSPNSTTASATTLVIRQATNGTVAGGAAPEKIVTTQLMIQSIATERLGEDQSLVFGAGIISDEINRSMTDSLAIVGPLALLFVLVVLVIAYRDLLDIVLGLFGIILVLVWTFGFMGWMDIAFNQLFVAVPVLLIGLSIDYAIHVFMRHREERTRGDDDVRPAMRTSLASVGIALTLVTATTVIGFLSNLISSVPPIRQFGVVSSVGIVAALLIFGMLVPALKSEIDSVLEARGVDRRKRAFGTGESPLSRGLAIGSSAARRAPWVVVLLTLLVSAGGVYGATQVNTTFDQTDFLADDPPEWMDALPEPFRPGEYSAKDSLTYVNENFVRRDSQAQILIRGDVTDPTLLDRLATAQDRAAESEVTVTLSNDRADLQSPLTAIETVAARNETFAALLARSDTDGDGRPERNVAAVYDALYAASPSLARNVIYRTDGGDYRAIRLVVSVRGGADGAAITSDMRSIAAGVDGSGVTVTATGQPIVFELVSNELLSTVIESLVITLVSVFVFLMLTYRVTHGSATLGIVTLLPVAFSVSWILGTMYLLGIPFNVLTGLITSLTVGLGVAYSIHISERFSHELERADDMWTAMETALTGTGGALLGSAATTVGGFGVLAFAILPPLRQFGIITGLTIIYAFLGSVLVLPTFLALWVRYIGPGGGAQNAGGTTGESTSVTTDGGAGSEKP